MSRPSSARVSGPVLDARRQPAHRRPASAEETDPKAQADDQRPLPRLQQQLAHPPGRLLRIAPRWYRSALLATRREFSASRASSLAVNSSISLRSISSRLRSRSVKSFALEVNSVQFSFQSPPLPRLRVQRRDVVHALARHFEARLAQSGDDLVAIPHRPVLDALEQVVPDQVAGGRFEPEPGPQPRRLDVGAVAGLLHSGPAPDRLDGSSRVRG